MNCLHGETVNQDIANKGESDLCVFGIILTEEALRMYIGNIQKNRTDY